LSINIFIINMLVVVKINSQTDLVKGLPTLVVLGSLKQGPPALVVLGSLKQAASILGYNLQANQ
jgi:hypothetical protein